MKLKKKYAFVLLIISIVITLFNMFLFSENWTLANFANMFLWCLMYTSILGFGNALGAEYLNNKFDWYYQTSIRVFIGIVFTVLYSFLGAFVIMYVMLVVFDDYSFSELLSIRALSQYVLTTKISVFISLFFHLRGFLMDWKRQVKTIEELKRKQIESKLEGLQKQMDAHFLFNSLSVLREIIDEDKKLAGEFVESFADVYRYIVEYGSCKTVPLKQELNFIKDYVFLHEARFENSIKVKYFLDNCDQEKRIPPLALQTAVENAIKHNVFSITHPLEIEISCIGDAISIQNNVNLKMNVKGSGTGLRNLNDRLILLGKSKSVVKTDGKVYRIEIPLI